MTTADPIQSTPQDTSQDTRPARDWTDRAIEIASGLTAVAMFAYGVALSYSVLHRIAQASGRSGTRTPRRGSSSRSAC
jgi:hypothetical protein